MIQPCPLTPDCSRFDHHHGPCIPKRPGDMDQGTAFVLACLTDRLREVVDELESLTRRRDDA